jgi:cellulose synthase/poly-beta-1,6-N-acetylglucosamine synthase-like glycosyltransferase
MALTELPLPALLLLAAQAGLLLLFAFFASFNYLYGLASLGRTTLARVAPSGRPIAVVVVSFNERHVLDATLQACDALTYRNRLIVLADDSTDPDVIESLRHRARERGCARRDQAQLVEEVDDGHGQRRPVPIEIWEAPGFVLFHRPRNLGFKGGSLRRVQQYLQGRGVELMYLLDADWHPQADALERTLGVLEADDRTAFVQTKRISISEGLSLFQKHVSLVEEGCYYVDFEGRQRLGHPTLFSGCCTLFRLDALAAVGGFTPGHLTEDLDLTDRLWLAGWKGVYDGTVVNRGEVPFTYDHFRRQQERWAAGSARALREHGPAILASPRLSLAEKLSALRQNAYFTTSLLTTCAISVGAATVVWLALGWNGYPTEAYLWALGQVRRPALALLYFCILSNFVEPLAMILVKTRRYRDLLHLPMAAWYAWSVIPTYLLGSVKGLLLRDLDWFVTPKYQRSSSRRLPGPPRAVRLLHLLAAAAFACLYAGEGWTFGWFDEFSLLLLPAFLLASIR